MGTPDKIVLEHAGALGDFLLAWPAFLSLVRHFADLPVFYAVRPAHAHWMAPLARPCPPELRRALDARFAETAWPKTLENTLVVRPGLAVRPALPESENFLFLQGVVPGTWEPPQTRYREALAARHIPFATDFAATFRDLFGAHAPQGATALLFPGAGHPDKAWPLARFECLSAMLQQRGIRPVFVLGPAERDRGLAPGTGKCLAPENLTELAAAIRSTRFVVGPDCGPLHLAGLHGVPGVALFGPTSPRQWGPSGLDILTAGLSCSPCAEVTSGDFAAGCPRPLPCLEAVTVEQVWNKLQQWLA